MISRMTCLSLLILSSVAACGSDGGDEAKAGETCGGVTKISCTSGTFCDYPAGNCGENDREGNCETAPDFCASVFEPVCGCDGKTYSNQCAAMQASVSVKSEGECPK